MSLLPVIHVEARKKEENVAIKISLTSGVLHVKWIFHPAIGTGSSIFAMFIKTIFTE